MSKTTIMRLEQGRVVAPKPTMVTLIDEVLDAGGELIAMLPTVTGDNAAPRPRERRGRTAPRSARRTRTAALGQGVTQLQQLKRQPIQNREPKARTERSLSPCGTRAAYDRHRKHEESPCEACTHARAQERIQQREKLLAEAAAGYGAALGARVRQLRNAKEMSPVALSTAAQVSKTAILRLELGRVMEPKPTMVKLIDEALDAGGELVAMRAERRAQ